MSQKQHKPDLAAALADVSGSSRRRVALSQADNPAARTKEGNPVVEGREDVASVYQAPSRSGTAPITGHFPRQVRDQLKILAIERGSTLYNLMAEAYNDLFAKYGKPEIAPQQTSAK
jgi:hypothetical protein